jgi:2-keto-4-pentenoate hydratase/2-oxohepta-3-ene-1,7-dioic acid hydratase in catechol pathway
LVEGSPRIGPCVGRVGKIIGVGLNYADHAAESNMPVPSEPPLFIKAASTIVGSNDDVEIPLNSEKTEWEVELGVVIGEPAKNVALEQAMYHVAGYCIVNDISERAYQLDRGGQWDKGKNCDTFAPIGPWLVTPNEILDPHNLDLWLEVDGHPFQKGNTRTMIQRIPELIAYISHRQAAPIRAARGFRMPHAQCNSSTSRLTPHVVAVDALLYVRLMGAGFHGYFHAEAVAAATGACCTSPCTAGD